MSGQFLADRPGHGAEFSGAWKGGTGGNTRGGPCRGLCWARVPACCWSTTCRVALRWSRSSVKGFLIPHLSRAMRAAKIRRESTPSLGFRACPSPGRQQDALRLPGRQMLPLLPSTRLAPGARRPVRLRGFHSPHRPKAKQTPSLLRLPDPPLRTAPTIWPAANPPSTPLLVNATRPHGGVFVIGLVAGSSERSTGSKTPES